MADVIISEAIAGAEVDRLAREFSVHRDPDLWKDPDRLAEQLASAKAIIVRNQTKVTRELIESSPHLVVIARAGVGLDNIDTEAAADRGVVVTFTPRENSIAVAELTLGLMLSMVRMIPSAIRDTRAGGWNRFQFMGSELYDKTIGIVGLGRIGQLVAARARSFGMNILAHDPLLPSGTATLPEGKVNVVTLDELLSKSDFVTLHVPLLDVTRHLMNGDRLGRMKPGARLINTSRGEVVCETSLIASLESGRLAGAALDVRECEPPTVGKLETMENVLLVPHVGAFTHEAQARVVAAVCDDVRRVLSGEPANNAVGEPTPGRVEGSTDS